VEHDDITRSELGVAEFTGPRVGAYTLIREIGSGGMGTVYLAVRHDDAFEKRVAIKILKRGMDSDSIVRRFRNERQILASLQHPYIASLLDGGTTAEGLPYFAMEYIEGRRIVDYCDAHQLDTSARIELFRTVCAAVQYAHQNLIIHRDIKPANVLVTPDGTPKLLDFGIAKLLNPELAGETIAPTAAGPQLMTPEYASPEQVRGEPVTTATDVYSLGVLLYELLTGRRPYRLTSRTPAEIARVVCNSVPVPPSTAVTRTAETAPASEPETGSVARPSDTEATRPAEAGGSAGGLPAISTPSS
jgi:serine/threonine protein kinase